MTPAPAKSKSPFNLNFDWIVNNFAALVRQYPNRWIAVDRGRVLASDLGLDAVQKAATSEGKPGEIAYYFVDDGSLIFALS